MESILERHLDTLRKKEVFQMEQKPLKEQKAVLLILLSNIFIAFLGIGLIIPVMPSFMNIMHLSGSTMGYLVAVFAFAQLITSPFA